MYKFVYFVFLSILSVLNGKELTELQMSSLDS